MEKYKDVMRTISSWLLLCAVASLPYTHAIIRPLWVAWLIVWVLELSWLQKPAKPEGGWKTLVPLFALTAWVAWELLSASWSADKTATWRLLERHVNFPIVLLVCLYGLSDRNKAATLMRVLIASSVISVGVYLYMHYWIDNVDAALNDLLKPTKGIDWFGLDELTFWIKHRLYYATVLTLSVIFTVYLLPEHIRLWGRWQAITLTIAALLILLAGIWWSGSRANIVNIFAIAGIWAIAHTPGKKKVLTALGLTALLCALAWGAVKHYPRFEGRTAEEIFAYHPELEEPSFEPRIAIWHTAVESPGEYVAYGFGAGASKGYMTAKYQSHGWNRLVERQYTPHNQYLTECIELGIVAAVLFALIWLLMPLCHRGSARKVALYVCVVCQLTMLTESFLDRIEGVLTVCVVLIIIRLLDREEAQSVLPLPD